MFNYGYLNALILLLEPEERFISENKKTNTNPRQIYIGFLEFLRGNLSMQQFCCELLCSKKYLKFLVFIFAYKDSRFISNKTTVMRDYFESSNHTFIPFELQTSLVVYCHYSSITNPNIFFSLELRSSASCFRMESCIMHWLT
jgi:hypothetical protein